MLFLDTVNVIGRQRFPPRVFILPRCPFNTRIEKKTTKNVLANFISQLVSRTASTFYAGSTSGCQVTRVTAASWKLFFLFFKYILI